MQEFVLWNQPFYRHETYAHDLRANLRNVAVPGTVIPLSVFCYFKVLATVAATTAATNATNATIATIAVTGTTTHQPISTTHHPIR